MCSELTNEKARSRLDQAHMRAVRPLATDWRAGFVVLTYKDGRLLWPDVCHVVAPGVVEFRGTEIAV